MNEPMKVPFYCPACGAMTEASMLSPTLHANPYLPVLQCDACDTEFNVGLYPVDN